MRVPDSVREHVQFIRKCRWTDADQRRSDLYIGALRNMCLALPAEGTKWSLRERARWLQAAAVLGDLARGDGRTTTIYTDEGQK